MNLQRSVIHIKILNHFHILVVANQNDFVQDPVSSSRIEIDDKSELPSYDEVMKNPYKYPLSNSAN